MIPWIVDAKYDVEFRLHVTFNDGVSGEINFAGEFGGEIFESLKDVNYFKKFKLEGHNLAWENGADFAPEYFRALIAGKRVLQASGVTFVCQGRCDYARLGS